MTKENNLTVIVAVLFITYTWTEQVVNGRNKLHNCRQHRDAACPHSEPGLGQKKETAGLPTLNINKNGNFHITVTLGQGKITRRV